MIATFIIIFLLVIPYLLVRIFSKAPESHNTAGTLGLTLVFAFTGIGHFIKTEPMVEMIPAFIPQRHAIIYITGVVELAAAILVLLHRYRRQVGWFIILMLLSFLPFNLYAAVNHVPMGGHEWGPVYLLIRVPLQLILIVWTYWFTIKWQNQNN